MDKAAPSYRVTYDVAGTNGRSEYPYISGITSLKEAVAVAKRYPNIYGDGAATHIVRSIECLHPDSAQTYCSRGATHRWRVFADGYIELLLVYQWPFARQKSGLMQWRQSLPLPPFRHVDHSLQTELHDLIAVAEQFGYRKAAESVRQLIRGST